eukprot:Selendium_serpulae@DN10149_c0_g1_i1.p1
MGLLRSEVMKHGVILLPRENAAQKIEALSLTAELHYEDMVPDAMHRPNRAQMQRIDEINRQLRALFDMLNTAKEKLVRNNFDNFTKALHPLGKEGKGELSTSGSKKIEAQWAETYTLPDIEKEVLDNYMSLARLTETQLEMNREVIEVSLTKFYVFKSVSCANDLALVCM